VLVKVAGSQAAHGPAEGCQTMGFSCDRIFACSGAGSEPGSIIELRYGLEARIGLVIEQEDSSGIMDVWAIPNLLTGGTFFLFSNPLTTSIISMPIDAADEIYAMNEETTGLDLGLQTLAAGSTPDGVVVQVTGLSVRLSVLGDENNRFSSRCQESTESIIAATVRGNLSLFAAAIRTEKGVHVHLRNVKIQDSSLQCGTFGQPLSIIYEPVSLTIEQVDSNVFLFIGTSEGKLLVARIDTAIGILPLSEHSITLGPGNDESTACEFLTLVSTSKTRRQRYTLFCGLRSGNLVPFNIHVTEAQGTQSIGTAR